MILHDFAYGPLWARFSLKIINFNENHKTINKTIKGVKSEEIKIKTWFGDKDLFS